MLELIQRITVHPDHLAINMHRPRLLGQSCDNTADAQTTTLRVPVSFRRRGVEAKLILGHTDIAGATDQKLIETVARAHDWLDRLSNGAVATINDLAAQERLHPSDVTRILPLAFLAPDIVEAIGLALVQAGLMLAVAQGAGIAGRLAWGAIADRVISARRILAVLALVMAAAAVMTGLFGPGWPFAGMLAVAVLFGASAVGWNGIYLSEIVRVTSPERSARATGGVLIFTFGGMMVGPAVFGALAATAGFTTAFVAVAAVTLLPGLFLFRREPAAGPA